MAIVIDGKTKCPICGMLIRQGQEIVPFPAFVSNELDDLWFFNDAAFHSACFHAHPLAEKAVGRLNEFRKQTGAGKRFCIVCEKEIYHPDDYFAVGHLVEET